MLVWRGSVVRVVVHVAGHVTGHVVVGHIVNHVIEHVRGIRAVRLAQLFTKLKVLSWVKLTRDRLLQMSRLETVL